MRKDGSYDHSNRLNKNWNKNCSGYKWLLFCKRALKQSQQQYDVFNHREWCNTTNQSQSTDPVDFFSKCFLHLNETKWKIIEQIKKCQLIDYDLLQKTTYLHRWCVTKQLFIAKWYSFWLLFKRKMKQNKKINTRGCVIVVFLYFSFYLFISNVRRRETQTVSFIIIEFR